MEGMGSLGRRLPPSLTWPGPMALWLTHIRGEQRVSREGDRFRGDRVVTIPALLLQRKSKRGNCQW